MLKALTLLTAGWLTAVGTIAQDADAPVEAPVQEQEAPEVKALADIEAYMRKTVSLKGKFIQQNADGTVARGDLYLERPGRVRFDYSDDTPFLIVADGEKIAMIDEETGKVSQTAVKETPLRILLGETLDLSRLHASVLTDYAGHKHLVALRAKDRKKPELGELTVIFRKVDDGLELYRWAVLDSQGQMTIVEVSELEENPKLAKALWTFEDPRGSSMRRRGRR